MAKVRVTLQSAQDKSSIDRLDENPDQAGNRPPLAQTGSPKPRARPKKEDRRGMPIQDGDTRLGLASREFIGEVVQVLGRRVRGLVVSKLRMTGKAARHQLSYFVANGYVRHGVHSHGRGEGLGGAAWRWGVCSWMHAP